MRIKYEVDRKSHTVEGQPAQWHEGKGFSKNMTGVAVCGARLLTQVCTCFLRHSALETFYSRHCLRSISNSTLKRKTSHVLHKMHMTPRFIYP
jgi:hypothetical protein